jgi:tetratricopeptide (TPR) repeat protein
MADSRGGEVRYRLLETIRQFAAEKLAEAGEELMYRTRHRDWCLALSDAAEPELTGPRHATWAARLAAEHENLRAALAWNHARGDGATGLQLAANLGWYWLAEGHSTEGCRWLDLFAGTTPQPTALRARALCSAALLERHNGNTARSVALGEESAAIARALGDQAAADAAEVEIGLAEASAGNYPPALARLEACLRRARARQDVPAVRDRTRDLGLVRIAFGELASAKELFAESLALARKTGNEGMAAMALLRLATLDRLEGHFGDARAQLEQACTLAQTSRAAYERFQSSLGNQSRAEGDFARAEAILTDVLVRSHARGDQLVMAEQLCWIGVLRIAQGQFAEGTALIGVGAVVSPARGTIHTPDLRLETEASLDCARAALGDESFSLAWTAGRTTTAEACIVDGALREPTISRPRCRVAAAGRA